jgi:hypothetical protein
MAELSIQDAAFTGFRVVRQHPKALVAWWVYALGLSLAVSVLFLGLAGRDFTELMAISRQQTLDPTRVASLLARLAPVYTGLLVLGMVSNAILGAAMIRAVLRPADDRFGYLRLGADELRQLGLVLLGFLVFMGVYLAVAIVVGVLVGIVGALAKAGPNLLVSVLLLSVAAVMLVLAVRLSLAPALTFDRGRVNLFGSWPLTRGRFWSLFGVYLLALALVAVVYLLSFMLIFAVSAILSGGDPTAAWKSSADTSLASYFAPARLAQTVLNAGVSALIWPVLLTPAPAIYRALSPALAAGDAFA